MTKVPSAFAIVKLDKKVSDFVSVLRKCRSNEVGCLYLRFADDTVVEVDKLNDVVKKKIRFIYNAFRVESSQDFKLQLRFMLKRYDAIMNKIVKRGAKCLHNDLEGGRDCTQTDCDQCPSGPNDGQTFMTDGFGSVVIPQKRDHVVIGGTFDRLHNGHRLLLAVSSLLAQKTLGIGVTTQESVRSKTLCEFIQPLELRVKSAVKYVEVCDPGLEILVDHISDGVGFSGTLPLFDSIVSTIDTQGGVDRVNSVRKNNLLPPLENFVIQELLEDKGNNTNVSGQAVFAVKLSSTLKRLNELGTLRQPVTKPFLSHPYIIGVTGWIASGKSSICKILEKKGAAVIDCDSMAHDCYMPGTACYRKILATFGESVLGTSQDGTCAHINRRKLGEIVFSGSSEMDRLNEIVWPELIEAVAKRISTLKEDGVKVVVLDAALLYESKMDSSTHEVWYLWISKGEAIERLMARNNFSREEAECRVAAGGRIMSGGEKMQRAHVVLTTMQEYESTRRLVDKAWDLLGNRMSFDSGFPS